VAQSGVVYETCLEQQGDAPDYVNETFGMKGHVKCCKGRQCGHGAVYLDSWPPVTQESYRIKLTLSEIIALTLIFLYL